ncbi:MFS transporter [Allobranchiibius sp. CTAmp26]|uniref:MFS transporter n=1 Tax=Allobranchiibius sp. CTAmp26 TaxID=2815214 RepID=UPI001AA106E4|nr:MFS transporter [Allobranchiibius sp. CTAmp26]MBO1754654.1 MFS transporter [Allobranchiibius sp. CTAmp26]
MAGGRSSTPEQLRLQSRWYWYDWSVTAYITVTLAVLFSPYLTSIANKAACPTQPSDRTCHADLHVLGIPVAPGSLVPYTITVATIVSAFVLVVVGAMADRSRRPLRFLTGFTAVGSVAAAALCLVAGTRWALGMGFAIVANVCVAGSLIVYSAIMCRITPPDDRDRVSARGWSYGYLGGGLLLVVNLVFLSLHGTLGLSTTAVVRISFGVNGLWWAVFAVYSIRGLRTVPHEPAAAIGGSPLTAGVRQLRATFAELRGYPQTLRFLLAYLFYNDGVQTVIASASLYGAQQLKFSSTELLLTILLVQFVAFGGALGFGRLARRVPARDLVLRSLYLWTVVVILAFFVPRHAFMLWLLLATGIGLVLGGTQALSRSLYSHLVPHGREAEFFSLYQAMDRGTSWLGTLTFGVVYQLFHDYRLSIGALIVFFVVGGTLLRTVDVRQGVEAAGNEVPAVV